MLEKSFMLSKLPVPDDLMQIACDYSCDGCYEPMFSGRSEFKFAYVFPMHVRSISLFLPITNCRLTNSVYKTISENCYC